MKYVKLEIAKQHIYVDEGYDGDDAIITQYIDAAEIAVSNHIRRNLAELEDSNGKIPAAITQGVLLVVGGLYRDREVNFISEKARDKTGMLDYLLGPYIDYSA